MNKITSSFLGFGILSLITNTTLAASLSILPSLPNVALDDTFSLTIEGQEFSLPVDGIGVTVSWNPSIIDYTGMSFASPWDTTFINDANTANGIIDVIFAGSTDGAGTDFQLANLEFTALSAGSTDVVIGTSGGGCVAGACGIFSGTFDLETDYVSAQVNVVPIPAAAWLFGTGLLGLIGIIRRKT